MQLQVNKLEAHLDLRKGLNQCFTGSVGNA